MEQLSVAFLYVFFTLVGLVGGLFAGAALGIITLRLSAKALGFGEIRIGTAFLSALLANFVCLVVNFAVGFNHGLSMGLLARFQGEDADRMMRYANPMFLSTPTHHLYAIAFGLVIVAVIFTRTLRKATNETPLTFRDGFALSTLYFAMTFTALALLGAFVYLVISLLTALA